MEKDDARRLSPDALEQMRRQAIGLRKQGKGPTEIGRILGVRSNAPRGQTPAINLSAKQVSTNLISAITNQGKVRFMLYQYGRNTQVLIGFLKRLIKDSERKVFLILDNLRVHHAKLVRPWPEAHKQEIGLFYLPACQVQLTPDEYELRPQGPRPLSPSYRRC